MKYLSVCSGIEAATVAWEPLGWEAFAYSEIEQFPSAVLKHHYPETPNFGDMTKHGQWPESDVDVLVGGTPCQSFSVAGLRAGMADPRGNLALTYLAIADQYRPRWVLWENVPGVLSSNGGKDFGAILGGLGELGYGFAYRILDAQYFGVAQRRRRVFVVGYLGDWRRAAAVLFERHSLQGHPAPSRKARQAVAALTATGVGTCGAGDNQGQAGHLIAHTLRGEGFDASEDGTGRGTPIVPVMTCIGEDIAPPLMARSSRGGAQTLSPGHQTDGHCVVMSSGQANAEISNNLSPALNCNRDGSPIAALAFAENARGELRLENGDGLTTGPLTTGGGKPGQGYPAIAFQSNANTEDIHAYQTEVSPTVKSAQPPAVVKTAVRRLTVTECCRLQGFPDSYTRIPYRGKPAEKCPDGPQYKALGNSFAVPVVRWIGERIQMVGGL